MAQSKQLIAITEIIMGVKPGRAANPVTGEPAVRPVTRVVEANGVFIAPNETIEKELIEMNAARVPTEDDMARITGRRVKDMSDDGEPAKTAKTAKTAKDQNNEPNGGNGGGDGSNGGDNGGDGGNGGNGGNDDLDALRQEYEEVLGQKPGNRGAEKMREEISAKKAENLV